MLHAIVLAGKSGSTVGPRANVLSLARVGSEVAGQVSQRREQPSTCFAHVLSLAQHPGLSDFLGFHVAQVGVVGAHQRRWSDGAGLAQRRHQTRRR